MESVIVQRCIRNLNQEICLLLLHFHSLVVHLLVTSIGSSYIWAFCDKARVVLLFMGEGTGVLLDVCITYLLFQHVQHVLRPLLERL